MQDVAETLRSFLGALGAEYTNITEETVAGQHIFMIHAPDGKALIGPHGDTIHALDFLIKKMVGKDSPTAENEHEAHFLIDVNEYRTKQIRDLEAKALMMAERARSFQYDVELSPMSAYERLIVHTTLQNAPNVKTESQGEGRNRRVVIRYAA